MLVLCYMLDEVLGSKFQSAVSLFIVYREKYEHAWQLRSKEHSLVTSGGFDWDNLAFGNRQGCCFLAQHGKELSYLGFQVVLNSVCRSRDFLLFVLAQFQTGSCVVWCKQQ